jgi:hypothetical protein
VFHSQGRFFGYCTDGTRSTALPRKFSHNAIPMTEAPAQLRAKYSTLFNKDNYSSVRVDAGDFVFFEEGQPHFGVEQDKKRTAVFIMVIGQTQSRAASRSLLDSTRAHACCCMHGHIL